MPNVNMNYSYASGLQPTLAEAYIQRKALKNVEPNLIYARDAQKVALPKNSGKYVRFHRYTELPAITKPLHEGVTPDGQTLTETSFEVATKNFGGWMGYTDELDLWHVDKKTDAIGDRLIRQARLSIDTAARDQIMTGLNVMYPGNKTSRAALTSSDVLTYAMIKKVVRNLKKKGAQPFSDGYYHAIIDHDTYYDLTQDSNWADANKYQDKERESKYMLGILYKVKFYESDNGKIFTAESYLYNSVASLTVSAFDQTTGVATVTATDLTTDIARELEGKLVYINYTKSSTQYVAPVCIEKVTPATKAVKLRWIPDGMGTGTLSSITITPSGGATSGDEVHASIIYGQDAYGMVSLGGAKEPNIRIIAKPLGSSGTEDPLDQRGSLAWKVPFFACTVLQDDFIVRLEHGVSA